MNDIIATFPNEYKISEETLKEIIGRALEIKLYMVSQELILDGVKNLRPAPAEMNWEIGSEFRNHYEWTQKVWKWASTDYLSLWHKTNGDIHTKEEACDLCADMWVSKIFNKTLQDNGAWNEGEHGFKMNAFGSMLKAQAMAGVSQEVIDKTREGIKNHYRSDPYGRGLSCDYGPCTDLWDILLEAGVPKDDISHICPWKTGIRIMREDNSVSVYTYQKFVYY